MRREMRLKTTIGLVIHRFKHLSGENMGFKENHGRDYTPMAYICNQKKCTRRERRVRGLCARRGGLGATALEH